MAAYPKSSPLTIVSVLPQLHTKPGKPDVDRLSGLRLH